MQKPATAFNKPALSGKKRQLLVPQQASSKRVFVQVGQPCDLVAARFVGSLACACSINQSINVTSVAMTLQHVGDNVCCSLPDLGTCSKHTSQP
jgi:hypothetical protein